MSDVPFLRVEVYKPGWRLQIRLGLVALVCVCATLLLVFLWWGFSLSTLLFMDYQEALPIGLVLALVALMVYGASVFDDRRVKKRLRESMVYGGGGGTVSEMPDEAIAREAHGEVIASETHGEIIARESPCKRIARETRDETIASEGLGEVIASETHGECPGLGEVIARERPGEVIAREMHGEVIAREIREMSLSGCRDLPGRFVSETNAELPEAIVLHCGDRFGPGTMVRPVKEPLSYDMPFEPLPLGRDPERTCTLLDNFVWKYPKAGRANAGGSGAGRYFSASRAASVFSLPGTLGAVGGMLLLVLLAGDMTKLYLVACVAGPPFVYHVGRRILSWYRESSTPLVWLFPGVIGIRGGRGDSADQRGDVVVRRGSGTLWYDAVDAKLFVPLPNGGHRMIKCPLDDGIIAVWAWLNTARAPDRINLDEIS